MNKEVKTQSAQDFIDAHNTMLRHPDKYKIEYFPVDGQELRRMREDMIADFVETQCELEVQMYYQKKNWNVDNDLARFIHASRERQAIFWCFNKKGYPDGWTVSIMADYLDMDRTQCSKILSSMHENQYILRNTNEGFQRYYLPSNRLLNNAKYFCEHYVDLTLSLTETPERMAFFSYRAAERTAFSKREKVVGSTS